MLRRLVKSTARGARNISSGPKPRLPIPPLEQTCSRYLDTVSPILAPAERKHTEAAIAEFLNGPGPKLQQRLEEYNRSEEFLPDRNYFRGSYLEKFWDDMYLNIRDPLVVNVNPFLTFQPDGAHGSSSPQVERAAGLAYHSASMLQLIQNKQLWVHPECASQYFFLFGTSRRPRPARDELLHFPHSRHIAVLHKGQFYALDVINRAGGVVPEACLRDHLRSIVALARDSRAHDPFDVTTLTCGNRDEWAAAYGALRLANPDAMHTIESALFHVVLEDREPANADALLMLHGHGRGRWHDQSLSIVVCPDGQAGFSFEHTWGDGQTVMRWANHVSERAGVHEPMLPTAGVLESDGPRLIQLETSPYIRACMARSYESVAPLLKSVQLTSRVYPVYGKAACKAMGVSPDAMAQMAFQRAFVRMHGALGSTYESCSTKHFHHGRTETIRSATAEAAEWARAEVTDPKAADLLRRAVSKHVEVAKYCRDGQGVDRHLMGLSKMVRPDEPTPAVFTDAAYKRMKTDLLSTSNCGSGPLQYFGFGPTTSKCWGIGYMIHDDSINFTVSSFDQDSAQMAERVSSALTEARDVLQSSAPPSRGSGPQ